MKYKELDLVDEKEATIYYLPAKTRSYDFAEGRVKEYAKAVSLYNTDTGTINYLIEGEAFIKLDKATYPIMVKYNDSNPEYWCLSERERRDQLRLGTIKTSIAGTRWYDAKERCRIGPTGERVSTGEMHKFLYNDDYDGPIDIVVSEGDSQIVNFESTSEAKAEHAIYATGLKEGKARATITFHDWKGTKKTFARKSVDVIVVVTA